VLAEQRLAMLASNFEVIRPHLPAKLVHDNELPAAIGRTSVGAT
jgi:hypothetical protein